jgi:hypothetical protein
MNDKAIVLSPFASVEQFGQVQQMATALSCSMFVPDKFRGDMGHPNCIMALGIASRLNTEVLSVMNALYEVKGKIGFEAKFLIACVNASGKFDPIRWRFEGKEGTDSWGARAYAKDRQSGEELVGTLVTIGMAKKEGWFGKSGSKWQTMPEQMLRYRSASFWISTYAGEYAMGMRTQEDLQDEIQAPPAEVIESVTSKQFEKPRPTSLDDVVDMSEGPVISAAAAPKMFGITEPVDFDVSDEALKVAERLWPQAYKTKVCEMASGIFGFEISTIEQMNDSLTVEQIAQILKNLNRISGDKQD